MAGDTVIRVNRRWSFSRRIIRARMQVRSCNTFGKVPSVALCQMARVSLNESGCYRATEGSSANASVSGSAGRSRIHTTHPASPIPAMPDIGRSNLRFGSLAAALAGFGYARIR